MADRLPAEAAGGKGERRVGAEGEAQDALLALGYKPSEVAKMLQDLDATNASTEELIREALKRVHRQRH
jgi:Holliday junction resolvasome RuvABC DNA-binding subunit